MRIDPNSNIEGMHDVGIKNNTTISQNNAQENNKLNQDRIEFSQAANSFDELSAVKDKVVKEVEASTSPDRLRELKAQIENGTYFVSSEDIAGAIMTFSANNGDD